FRERPGLQAGEYGDPASRREPGRNGREGLFPGALLILLTLGAVQHPLQPVRVVEPLERRLAARAKPAAVYRVPGVSFRLGDSSVPVPDMHSAARRALTAGGGVELPGAGRDVFRRYHLGDQLVDELARGIGGKRNAASSGKP